MRYTLPIASGKGGVGKTLISANLGIALAQSGKTVVVVDLDLGGSNLHTVLGIRNNRMGVGSFIYREADDIEALVTPTAQDRLYAILGDGLYSGTANLPFFRKRSLIRQLGTLTADFVILDLGSGSTFNTLDFYLTSNSGLIVTTPDTTAVLNAYSFMKAAAFRVLQRCFPPKSAERAAVMEFMQLRVEGAERTLAELVANLAAIDPQSGALAQKMLEDLRPRVVLNQGQETRDIAVGTRLRRVVRDNLASDIEFIGYIPHDRVAARGAVDREPTLLRHPDCAFARALRQCATRILREPVPEIPKLFPDDEDLRQLAQEFIDRESAQPSP